jgi:hypothetical protein
VSPICEQELTNETSVLTAGIMKVTVFWPVAPCSLVGVDRHFALMMEAERPSEKSVYSY